MKGHIAKALNVKLFLYTVGGIVVTTAIVHYGSPSINAGASGGAPSIVQMALRIESHLSGSFLNQYDVQDPGLQDVIGYWEQLCGGSICVDAQPPLQCAMYVATVFAMDGHRLPQTYNAVDYWAGYANRQGWQETAAGSGLPAPGDMMVWTGGSPAPGYPNGYGHIAIVVAVQPPAGNTNGSVTVAQANGTYTLTTPDARVPSITESGIHLYQMPILPDFTVQTWPGFAVLGYIRDLALVQSSGSGYTVIGPPTITAGTINSILAANHSLAAGTGQALYDLGVQYGIDPVFALAFFQHESDFGTQGEATVTMSLGNERCIPDRPCVDQAHGGYAQMNSWEDGYQHWYMLIAGPAYVGAGLTTVEQIIPKYAPSSDQNNVSAYIQALEQAVNHWRAGN